MSTSHKGDYGHALIIAGNKGYMGAAVIAAKACLRTGTGLLTVNVPQEEKLILQVAIPEAILMMRETQKKDLNSFSAAGIGPGINIGKASKKILTDLLLNFKKPLVLDADALNIIAADKKLLNKIPKGTVLTPHPKEFDRLFGIHTNDADRRNKAVKMASTYHIIIVLKGDKTLITCEGNSFINTTGNAGLAKGGSGDALTGIITAFLAQGYNPFDAAKEGVFLHGLAADLALKDQSMESMLITDVIECLGKAFNFIHK